MKALKISLFSILALGLLFSVGCSDDDDAQPVSITSIVAEGTDLQTGDATTKDLNGASSAIDVPLDAVITVTFEKEVDATTATTSSITLAANGSNVDIGVAATGSTVTVTPSSELTRGTDYTLTLSDAIAAADGGQFSATSRTFTTAGRSEVVPPKASNQLAYWKFDGNLMSTNGTYNGEGVGLTYGTDRFGNVGSTSVYDGDVTIVEIPNGDKLVNESTTLSFWVKVDSVGHVGGHFVMGVGDLYGFFIEIQGGLGGMKLTGRYTHSDGHTLANDFFFNGDGQTAANGGWVAVEFEQDLSGSGGLGTLLDNRWAHVVYIYDAAINKRHLYIDGELMETDNLNEAPALAGVTGLAFDASDSGDVIGTKLAFGFNHDRETTHWANEPWGGYSFPDANHFKGSLDDIRIFDAALSDSEVKQLYNDEK